MLPVFLVDQQPQATHPKFDSVPLPSWWKEMIKMKVVPMHQFEVLLTPHPRSLDKYMHIVILHQFYRIDTPILSTADGLLATLMPIPLGLCMRPHGFRE